MIRNLGAMGAMGAMPSPASVDVPSRKEIVAGVRMRSARSRAPRMPTPPSANFERIESPGGGEGMAPGTKRAPLPRPHTIGHTHAPTITAASPTVASIAIIVLAVFSVSASVNPDIRPMIQNPLSFIHMNGLLPHPTASAR